MADQQGNGVVAIVGAGDEGEEGERKGLAGGVRGAWPEGGPVSGLAGLHAVRG
jgi:hypothetical protein